MSIPEGGTLKIREVFDKDSVREFSYINRLKMYFTNISIDTEFPGVLPDLASHPSQWLSKDELAYQVLKSNVDRMKLIQVGITLTNDRGELPVIEGCYCTWQFNLRDFDINSDLYAPASINLLKTCGIDFERNHREGIDSRKFASLLVKSNLICNRKIRYICFQGEYDFAYLIKIITGVLLPNTKAEYMQKELAFFGTVCDLRRVQLQHQLYGGLDKFAASLGIARIGAKHQAGSDSLLTSSTYQKIKESYLGSCKGSSDVMPGLAKTKVF